MITAHTIAPTMVTIARVHDHTPLESWLSAAQAARSSRAPRVVMEDTAVSLDDPFCGRPAPWSRSVPGGSLPASARPACGSRADRGRPRRVGHPYLSPRPPAHDHLADARRR